MADLTGKPGVLKKINLSKVMDLIRRQGPISRADLAKTLNISRPTISKLVSDLLDEKEILEIGEGESKGGKRPILLNINSKNAYVVGIHLSHPTTKIALANNLGDIMARRDMVTDSMNDIVQEITENIRACFHTAGLSVRNLSSIGIAISGMADPVIGEILGVRFAPSLKGNHLIKKLESKFKVPVFIDNDVYMGLIGQESSMESKPSSMAFVTIGELVGLGMMVEGKVYRGARHAAGEIGDMLIEASEQLSGGYNPDGGYLERLLGWDKYEAVLFKNGQKDAESEKIVSQYQLKIACCLANVTCLFDAERMFVGGKILESDYLPSIQELLLKIYPRAPKLEPAFYQADAELMGSVFAAIQKLRENLSINES